MISTIFHNKISETLIEDKLRKEREKVIHNWTEDGIRVEKARWGRTITSFRGKPKIELPKTVDATKLTLSEVKEIINKNAPKRLLASARPLNKQRP